VIPTTGERSGEGNGGSKWKWRGKKDTTNGGAGSESRVRVVPPYHKQPPRGESLARDNLALRVHLALHRAARGFARHRERDMHVARVFVVRPAEQPEHFSGGHVRVRVHDHERGGLHREGEGGGSGVGVVVGVGVGMGWGGSGKDRREGARAWNKSERVVSERCQ
jgi:hypothetical protein